MTRPADEYRALAAAEQARADAATLPNVRATAQQAADTWTRLAMRTELADAGREGRNGN